MTPHVLDEVLSNHLSWSSGADGIVTVSLGVAGTPGTRLGIGVVDAFAWLVGRLCEQRHEITGVIVTSPSNAFCSSWDLEELRHHDSDSLTAVAEKLNTALRRLEQLERPVVAVLDGPVLGPGLEIALACHRRVAVHDEAVRVGMPEKNIGLMPLAGGVTRLVRTAGIGEALPLLLQGNELDAESALRIGVVDELALTRSDALDRAARWMLSHPAAAQPWDRPGAATAVDVPPRPRFPVRQPALDGVFKAAVTAVSSHFGSALAEENEAAVQVATGQVARNMMKAFHTDLQVIADRTSGPERAGPKHVAVLGAGPMGVGIAHACAAAGMRVVLKASSAESAEKAARQVAGLVSRTAERDRLTPDRMAAVLARIVTTADPASVTGCDLVIETVSEDIALKHAVLGEVLDTVARSALLCSNTSSLPIDALAAGVDRPEDFVGLHFFSPVDRMRLVEVIRGRRTSEDALARAVDVVRHLGKVPIVVDGGCGFFASRVITAYLDEGVRMVAEGLPAAAVERASASAGYPTPLLSLVDDLSLTLPLRIWTAARAAVEAAGGFWRPEPPQLLIERMVHAFGRSGRAAGAGFYDYVDGKRLALWPGLAEHFQTIATVNEELFSFQDMCERLLFVESLETIRCLEDGILGSVADANIGSLFGIGFPAWTGGAVQYANGYAGGVAGFAARADELAERYGARFTPPRSLREMAATGETFD